MYRIREVDGDDEEVADTIKYLHTLTFGDTAPMVNPEDGMWWLVDYQREPVGFAGLDVSTHEATGYLCRSGVLHEHRGQGLQKRLIRVREAKARRLGWKWMHTDTADNPPSANSLIGVGYRMFNPDFPWGLPRSIYWRKKL